MIEGLGLMICVFLQSVQLAPRVQYVLTHCKIMYCSYQELNPNCVYADTETKENPFTFLLNVVCIVQSAVPSSFLNCENCLCFCCPSCAFVNEITLVWYADWLWAYLALTLLLS
jgi:hypothetical protein